jgi:hypothetical protein
VGWILPAEKVERDSTLEILFQTALRGFNRFQGPGATSSTSAHHITQPRLSCGTRPVSDSLIKLSTIEFAALRVEKRIVSALKPAALPGAIYHHVDEAKSSANLGQANGEGQRKDAYEDAH